MYKFARFILLLLAAPLLANAQFFPKEGSFLNYRIIGFRFPAEPKSGCQLQVAQGVHFNTDSFNNHIIARVAAKGNKAIAEVPAFGADYTWRVVHTDAAKKTISGPLHHFSTSYFLGVDTTFNRLRIIDAAKKHGDAYVFLEANRALYDMKGNPVWFLPKIDGITSEYVSSADLQVSPFGTVTFIYQNYAAYEVDYGGKILFRTPFGATINGDSIEHCHHEFRRLKNGHYMMMGSEVVKWDRSFAALNDSSSVLFPKDFDKIKPNVPYNDIPFVTLIEYDKTGKRLWYWKSGSYFMSSDIFDHIGKRMEIDINAHGNSFDFDEKNKYIYVGFRDISRILKVKYPEGKVVAQWGEKFKKNFAPIGNGAFCKQHSVKLASDGNLILFNNNSCNRESFPTVLKISQATGKDGEIKKIWEFKCPIEGENGSTQNTYQFVHGGNVQELADHAIFTSMSTLYSRVFIVTPDKKLLWSAIPEKWNKELKKWDLVYQYKASIIESRKELEKLIWNEQVDMSQ